MQNGLSYVDHTFAAVSTMVEDVNKFMAMPGISCLTASLGPIGIGINLGVKFINALRVIGDKGLVNGIRSLLSTPSDS